MNIFSGLNTHISVRLFTILSAVALLLSVLPVGMMTVHAAETLYSDSNVVVDSAKPYSSGPVDITGYTDLELNFDYEAETLDNGDKFTYGWRDTNGEHVIGFFNGKNEVGANKDTDETGSESESFAPQNGVTSIELFAEVDSEAVNPSSDEVVLITLDLTAVVAPDPEVNPSVDVCHATAAAANPYTNQTVDAKSIVNLPNGHDSHDDDGLDDLGDIIPSFDYNFGEGLTTYPGKNWDTLYSNGLTGEEIFNGGSCDGEPVETCDDGIQNQDETGVDIGGVCGDDTSPVETCDDGIQNQDETGVDTGGVCEVVTPAETCDDGIQNQDETDVDTGGVCEVVTPVETCDDGIQNQDETGVDIGGVCGDDTSPVETCDDGIQNQDETGVDVGGVCEDPQDNNGGGGSDQPTGACEIEGHKYDQLGNPLENWMMGLLKVASDGENTNIYYLLQDDTDVDGYYCLEWDNVEFNLQGEDNIQGDYTSFSYRVFEVLQEGWENLSVEAGADYTNLAVVPDEEIENDGEIVSVQIGEENGFIIADAEYHVDFYNFEIDPVDPGDECIPTDSDSCEEEVDECDPQTEECEEVEEEEGSSSSSGTRVGGRSSGGGTSLTAPTPTPIVSGATDSAPAGQVLGEQVSVVPYGGANAGGGATSPATNTSFAFMTVMLAALGLSATRRRLNV